MLEDCFSNKIVQNVGINKCTQLELSLPLDAASSASLQSPRKNKAQARQTHTSSGHSVFVVRDLYSCQNMIWKYYKCNQTLQKLSVKSLSTYSDLDIYTMYPATHSAFRHTYKTRKYLHSSLVITQVKGTVANPKVCMILFLANTSLKLEMTQQHISNKAAAFRTTVLSLAQTWE